jgi:hypothetical protein
MWLPARAPVVWASDRRDERLGQPPMMGWCTAVGNPAMMAVPDASTHEREGPMRSTANSFKGRWKIVWMEMWDQDFVDEELPGHITLADKGRGDFQFGYVFGSFAWSAKDARIDSLWEGNDEMDPAHGDIHCEIQRGELCGTIGLFNGDRSAFRAVRENE